MDTEGVPTATRGHRARKPAGRRSIGIRVKERDGYWHAAGRIRINGRSVRVRRSLGLAVKTVSRDQAEQECEAYVADLKAKVTGKIGRGDPVAIAALGYIKFPRERPLGPASVRIAQEIAGRFQQRRLNEIEPHEWIDWIDGRHTEAGFMPGRVTGLKASSRERIVSGVLAFLNFAKKNHGLAAVPAFTRDKKARNPNRRARRRVDDMRPDLIQILFDNAHIAIRAQLAVERSTGARVSSILYAARVCDLILAKGREQITFPNTKNGEDVTAVLDGSTVSILRDYLKWRGGLHRREEPLFLTPARKPYADNGRDGGGQNKTGFRAARRRAVAAIISKGEAEAKRLNAQGARKAAAEATDKAMSDAELVGKITQHWFRHRLATLLMRRDPRTAMAQGGWLDPRSVMGYSHDVPEYRRQVVAELDDLTYGRHAGKRRRAE